MQMPSPFPWKAYLRPNRPAYLNERPRPLLWEGTLTWNSRATQSMQWPLSVAQQMNTFQRSTTACRPEGLCSRAELFVSAA